MRRALIAAAFVLGALGALAASCSLGEGNGRVTTSQLFARSCWGSADASPAPDSEYDLTPDFFAANPYRNSLLMRIQRGNDIEEVSDGLTVLVDDVAKVRAVINRARVMKSLSLDAGTSDAGIGAIVTSCQQPGSIDDTLGPHPNGTATFAVSLPSGVTPPGSPAVPPADLLADPPVVHMSLYLQRSCHNQNTVLYSVSGTITFSSLFDGDPNEASAAEKLIEVTAFDVHIGSLADVPLGDYPRNIPCNLQTNLHGFFRFYFDRGQPAQPFP